MDDARDPLQPPDDPEAWTDEQWLEWLEANDAAADAADLSAEHELERRTAMQRIADTSVGTVIGNAMVGMANAIYGPKEDDIVEVADADGNPYDPSLDVEVDPSKRGAQVTIRKPVDGE